MSFLPMDLIQIQHYTATQAEAAFLLFVAVMFWTVTLGGLVARYGSRLPSQLDPLLQPVVSHFSQVRHRSGCGEL
jgi:hypothetical protein